MAELRLADLPGTYQRPGGLSLADIANMGTYGRASLNETLMPSPQGRTRRPMVGETVPRDLYEGAAGLNAEKDQPVSQLDLAMALVGGPRAPFRGAGIRAYHGSPHDFDKFDLSKIGTGEGAQAYGHGLYFAENEATARNYRDVLGGRGNVFVGGKQLPNRPTGNAELGAKQRLDEAAKKAGAAEGIVDYALRRAQEYADYMKGRGKYAEANANDVVAKLVEWRDRGIKAPDPGRMYEVDIRAKPEQFLDWDRPLAQQGEEVQKTLLKEPFRDVAAMREWQGSVYEPPSGPWGLKGDTGADLYTQLGMTGPRGADLRAHATQQLREAGIPGIKYLDQGSRTAGEGSSNYVVFDDSLIDILRKYGLAGMLGGGSGLSAIANQQANQ